MNLEKHNPHWKEGFFYPYEQKRSLYPSLVKNLSSRMVIALSGLRRTGKTVLLKQLIDFLIKERETKRETILYYSFDEEQPKIEGIIEEFGSKANLDWEKEKIYLFFDEIQKLENWQEQVKYYYDNFRNLKFFVSGSSSLFIRKKTRESLAGRCFDFCLPPLSFKEFLFFKGKRELVEKNKLFSQELKRELSLYSKRQFVETVAEGDDFVTNYMKSIIEKVIYIDLPRVFPIAQVDLLPKLLRLIAAKPGMIIEYNSLAKELGINRATLSNYLFYLEEAFLIKKLYNFSQNRLASEKKTKRFYLSSTSFFLPLCPGIEESKVIENLLAVETGANFFWRTPFKDEIDLVLENFENLRICPLEIKYRNKVEEKECRPILKFCQQFDLGEGRIITKDMAWEKTYSLEKRKVKVRFVPAVQFLLSFGE